MNPVSVFRAQAPYHRWAVTLGLAVLAGSAGAAQHKDPASGCVVIAPRYLASSDYTFAYQGGCKGGLAQGKGKAVWTLRYSPQNHVIWEGQFSAGVYLPPPPGIVSAREWNSPRGHDPDTAVFDMGALPAQKGIPAARLQVLASSDLNNYPDPCKPQTLWAVNAPSEAMVSDEVAKSVLASAVDRLKMHCGAALGKRMPGTDGIRLMVRASATPDLQNDQWGNPGPAIAGASVTLTAGSVLENYTNQAAAQQRQQQQLAQDQSQRQGNVERLRQFFNTHKAQGWAKLDDITDNPFRYADRVVVTFAQVTRVINPSRAMLYSDPDGWGGSSAVLDGQGIGQWKTGPMLLAVRVLGRVKRSTCESDADADAGLYCGATRLQLVGSQTCTEGGCRDWLHLPKPLQDGQVP